MTLNYNTIKDIDLYDRIEFLKDKAQNETAYIVTCGPSLTNHDRDILLDKLKGKFVIACKQAYEYVKDVTDIHCLSVYNYQEYEYDNLDMIRHWQFTAMNIDDEISRVRTWNQRVDILLPVYSTPWVQKHQSTSYTRNFDNWKLYAESKSVWGPGIMLESAIPLALHMGCKRIVTIGWDIGDISRFKSTDPMTFDDNWHDQHATKLYKSKTGAGPEYEELQHAIECTSAMYDWFEKENIQFDILSNTNPADERFNRITLEEL